MRGKPFGIAGGCRWHVAPRTRCCGEGLGQRRRHARVLEMRKVRAAVRPVTAPDTKPAATSERRSREWRNGLGGNGLNLIQSNPPTLLPAGTPPH